MLFCVIDEALNQTAYAVVMLRRRVAQVMNPTVYIAILLGVVVVDPVDHTLGLLRSSAIVQVDLGLAVHIHFKGRKVCPDPIYIQTLFIYRWGITLGLL